MVLSVSFLLIIPIRRTEQKRRHLRNIFNCGLFFSSIFSSLVTWPFLILFPDRQTDKRNHPEKEGKKINSGCNQHHSLTDRQTGRHKLSLVWFDLGGHYIDRYRLGEVSCWVLFSQSRHRRRLDLLFSLNSYLHDLISSSWEERK